MSYVRIVEDLDPLPLLPEKLALETKYKPDRFQVFAIHGIEQGDNVLVTAKTGSGKTFVGEYQIAKSLQKQKRVFYTTPIKSLTNQKFNDLKQLFPEASVGIMTGDIKFIPDAQILVMTTEILRNLLFKQGTSTESVGTTSLLSVNDVDAVIFDEVHYINDKDRGHVWEECLMLLPPSMHLILLSATLSNPYIFANWLGNLKQRKVWVISTLWRAVPLEHCILSNDGLPLTIYDSKEKFHSETYKLWLLDRKNKLVSKDAFQKKVNDAKRGGHEGPVSGKVSIKSFEHTLNDTLEYLSTHNSLPAIVFMFSRVGCESLAAKVRHTFIDSSDSASVAHIWDFHLSRYKSVLEKSPQMHTLRELAMRGIAFHHSGLLPFLKEILEILFSRGYIKVLFATETFAVGINMPTKTVIFTSLEKYTDGGFRPLISSEYIQMAGRAGRRGKDDKGLVLYIPQKDPLDLFEIQAMMTGKAASFSSRMSFHYDFIMKALNGGISMESLVKKSYWWALEDNDKKMIENDIVSLEKSIGSIYLTDDQMVACEKRKSLEECIVVNQNSKKKQAIRELDSWKQAHKDSVWKGPYEQYIEISSLRSQIDRLRALYNNYILRDSEFDKYALPQVCLRKKVLEGFGYLVNDTLDQKGILASEVNEGHPFLMTEFILRINKENPLSLEEFLSVLAIFVGESHETTHLENLSPNVLGQIHIIENDARAGMEREIECGLDKDENYWSLHGEWVEPIAEWLVGEHTLASLAHKFELFEGNVQKVLMKLSSLLEEVQSMATLLKNTDLLKFLEPGRNLILRDMILAESLYLRI